MLAYSRWDLIQRLKGIVKNPGNGRLNNLNDPVLNVLRKRTVILNLLNRCLTLPSICAKKHKVKCFTFRSGLKINSVAQVLKCGTQTLPETSYCSINSS